MAYQVIKFTLNADGSQPDFIYYGSGEMASNYPVPSGLNAPQDWYLINICADGATGDFTAFATKEDLESYLATNGADWGEWANGQEPIHEDPDAATWIPFDPTATANEIWAKMEALNA